MRLSAFYEFVSTAQGEFYGRIRREPLDGKDIMTLERWKALMDDRTNSVNLTEAEIAEGWHWCHEFDGLLVGPGMGELEVCRCIPDDHPARKVPYKP